MPAHAPVTAVSPLVVELGRARPDDRDLGGKASSLTGLALLGKPIPPGFCLTAAAYRAWLAGVEDARSLAAAIGRLPDGAARAEVVERLEATPTPEAVVHAIGAGLAAIAARIERPLLAVRSS